MPFPAVARRGKLVATGTRRTRPRQDTAAPPGPALARTLYGDVNPSGRLTATFPHSVGQEPLYYNSFNTGRPSQGQGHYVTGYRDESVLPIYPFGFGLSYTKFEYSPTRIATQKISAAELNHGGTIEVEATVKNVGQRAGTEVAQLYIRQRGTSVARPVRELKGFARIALSPGESRQVKFTLTGKELAFWNIDMQYTAEPCELAVWVAPDSKGGSPAMMMVTP